MLDKYHHNYTYKWPAATLKSQYMQNVLKFNDARLKHEKLYTRVNTAKLCLGKNLKIHNNPPEEKGLLNC